ncbi:MAG: polyprenyl glycosylphosphotransferase [Pseudobdellovibrio sp.]|jgi:exopolysaccharide biosynthesis polyprenyl glycosylphosphotransferase|nr:polyprenyl glycosylphosphotransferase [Pseudobdellovibrio sp.]
MESNGSRIAGIRRILFDSIILALCLVLFSYWFNPLLKSPLALFSSVAFYFIISCDLVIAFILGFSTSVFKHQRMNMLTMSVLRFLADLAVIQLFNYIFSKERTGLFSPQVLPLALAVTCFFAVFWRLLLFESLYFNSNYRIFCDPDSEKMIKKDLRNLFTGSFEYLLSVHILQKIAPGPYIYVVQDQSLSDEELQVLMQKKMHGFSILTITQFYEQVLRKIPIDLVNLKDLIFETGFELTSRMFLQRVKRVSDILLSFLLALVTWPVIFIFGWLHKFESPGPMFYSQNRTGKQGEIFKIYKLRSMRTDAEVNGAVWAQENDPRITKVGKFIRLTRIDELPQLLNVLKGDMSFIGPRPERPEFNVSLAEQIPFYDLRHSVRPGLTGWAQVRYPYGASVEDAKEKLQYDLYYIKNYSLLLDLEILVKTVQVVLFGKGR